jgi:PAS domain S-box-containing protein
MVESGSFRMTGSKPGDPPAGTELEMAGARILIVEDENIIAKDIWQRLEGLGYIVAGSVDNGNDAIEAAAAASPDLVLMDIILKSGMGGIEAAGIIRRRFDLPIIYLTAFGDQETLQRARITEPYGYILKPFEDRELHVNIEIALHRHATEMALRESEERFRMLAESSFEGVLVYHDGVALDANTRLARLLGYEPAEMPGKRLFDLVAPHCHDGIRKQILAGEVSAFEFQMQRKDGTTFPVEATGKPIRHRIPGVRVMVVRDLTIQKETERAMKLQARSELYGFVVSALPLISPGAYQQVREDLIKLFSDRFDAYFRPGYEAGKAAAGEGAGPFAHYLGWVMELFSNFGIEVSSSSQNNTGQLKFSNCPWKDYSANNPVFCMLCRAMVSRSFSWAEPGGSVGLKGTIAAGRDSCHLELRPRPG